MNKKYWQHKVNYIPCSSSEGEEADPSEVPDPEPVDPFDFLLLPTLPSLFRLAASPEKQVRS